MTQLRDLGVLPLAADLADAVLGAVFLVGLLPVDDPVAPVVTQRFNAHLMHVAAAAALIIIQARLCAVRLTALVRVALIVVAQLLDDLRIGVAAAGAVIFLQAGRGTGRLHDRAGAAVAAVVMAECRSATAFDNVVLTARQTCLVDAAVLGVALLGAGRLDDVLFHGVLVVVARDGIRLHLTAAHARAVLDAVGARGGLKINLPVAPVVAERRDLFLIPIVALCAHVALIAFLRAGGIVAGRNQLVAGRGQHDPVGRAAVLAHGDDGAVHRAGRLGAGRLPVMVIEINEIDMEARVRARDLRIVMLQRRRGQDIGDLVAVVIMDRQVVKDGLTVLRIGRMVRHDHGIVVAAQLHVHTRRPVLGIDLVGCDLLVRPLERDRDRAQLAGRCRFVVQRVVELQLAAFHIGQSARAVLDDIRHRSVGRRARLDVIRFAIRHRAETDKAISVGHGRALDVLAVAGCAGEFKRHPGRDGRAGLRIDSIVPRDVGRGAQRRGGQRRLFILQIVVRGVHRRRPVLVLEIRDELGLFVVGLLDLQFLEQRRQIRRAAARDGERNVRHGLRRRGGKLAALRRRERIVELKVARVVFRRGRGHVRELAAVGIDRQALAVIQHMARDLVDGTATGRQPEPVGIRKSIADMECPRCAGARVDDQLVAGVRRGVAVGGERLQTADGNEHDQRQQQRQKTFHCITSSFGRTESYRDTALSYQGSPHVANKNCKK